MVCETCTNPKISIALGHFQCFAMAVRKLSEAKYKNKNPMTEDGHCDRRYYEEEKVHRVIRNRQAECELAELANFAAERGKMAFLKYLVKMGASVSARTLNIAAGGAHLEMVIYLRENLNCSWGRQTSEQVGRAVKRGLPNALQTLKYIHDFGCSLSNKCFYTAMSDPKAFDFMIQNRFPFNVNRSIKLLMDTHIDDMTVAEAKEKYRQMKIINAISEEIKSLNRSSLEMSSTSDGISTAGNSPVSIDQQ
jgi:hypothetical protein